MEIVYVKSINLTVNNCQTFFIGRYFIGIKDHKYFISIKLDERIKQRLSSYYNDVQTAKSSFAIKNVKEIS